MEAFTTRISRTRWRRLIEQLGTLALSVVLALIVWLIAINQENPLIQKEYEERIPVAVRGLSANLEALQDLSKETVRVVLQAPRSSWDNLDVSDFNAYLDLTDLAEGVHDVAVQIDVVDPKVKIQDIQRPELRVQLDKVIEKAVPVRVDVLDSTAFGYDWQPPIVNPLTVTVRGPAVQVNQVAHAMAEVFLRNAKSQVERIQAVVPQSAQNQPVNLVVTNPAVAHVIVPVEQWPGRKEVAVRVSLVGQPAPGYRLSAVRVNPSTVVLLGNTEVLAQVPGFLETESVSLSEVTSEINKRLQLIVPENVTVLEGNTVDVTANIAAIEGGTTVRQRPVIQGLDPGLEATVALETVDVILSGSLPLLESLGPDDTFVILDLTGLVPGNHILVPRVVVPNGIRAEGVLPESVEVVITSPSSKTPVPRLLKAETPTPDSLPGSTSTPAADLTERD